MAGTAGPGFKAKALPPLRGLRPEGRRPRRGGERRPFCSRGTATAAPGMHRRRGMAPSARGADGQGGSYAGARLEVPARKASDTADGAYCREQSGIGSFP